jgi:hypothetical protein
MSEKFNFDLRRMKKMIKSDFYKLSKEIKSFEEFMQWLNQQVKK